MKKKKERRRRGRSRRKVEEEEREGPCMIEDKNHLPNEQGWVNSVDPDQKSPRGVIIQCIINKTQKGTMNQYALS